jgi:metal transporter CNNM
MFRRGNDQDLDHDVHSSENQEAASSYLQSGTLGFAVTLKMCIALVFAAMVLMSLDQTILYVLSISGTPDEQRHAKILSTVLKRRHLLLVTLLIGIAAAIEVLPMFLNQIPEYAAIISSVTFVLFLGELFHKPCSPNIVRRLDLHWPL